MFKIIKNLKTKMVLPNMKSVYISVFVIGFGVANVYNLNNKQISTAMLYC